MQLSFIQFKNKYLLEKYYGKQSSTMLQIIYDRRTNGYC